MESDMKKVYHDHMQTLRSFNATVLILVFPFLLAACSAGSGGTFEANSSMGGSTGSGGSTGTGGGSTSPDTTSLVISITAPTSVNSYDTTCTSVTVSGTATDNVGLSQIDWSNSTGGSGSSSVSGTSASRSFNVALLSGVNVISLTARDTSGNSSQRQLTVTYTPVTSNSASLAWDAVTASNLSGYRVYYGTTPGTCLQPFGQGITVGNTTTYTLLGLSSGTRYYFAVTAFDTSGNESVYSNEAFKDIP
jgi:hypothetical protein